VKFKKDRLNEEVKQIKLDKNFDFRTLGLYWKQMLGRK